MTVTLQVRALLVKLAYQKGDPVHSVVRTNIIRKFEAMGTLGIQSGKGRKCIAEKEVDDVVSRMEKDKSDTTGSTNIRRIADSVVQAHSIVKILRKMIHNYPYKCHYCSISYHMICSTNCWIEVFSAS
ncbi:hypothetical protein TNCV_2489951 [Trichonephila clavipes]|nr:hypothetical protein TNCV_2489951 [Trichonephila clavipes]